MPLPIRNLYIIDYVIILILVCLTDPTDRQTDGQIDLVDIATGYWLDN
jgi:hypothetical protein